VSFDGRVAAVGFVVAVAATIKAVLDAESSGLVAMGSL